MARLTESHIESAVLEWCSRYRQTILHGPDTLAALRDALLPKLISGKLRVKDAERFVKEAV